MHCTCSIYSHSIYVLYTRYICSCSQQKQKQIHQVNKEISENAQRSSVIGGSVRRTDDDVEKLNKRKQRTTNHRVPLPSFVCCLLSVVFCCFLLSLSSVLSVTQAAFSQQVVRNNQLPPQSVISTTITRLEQLKLSYTLYIPCSLHRDTFIGAPRNNLISSSEPQAYIVPNLWQISELPLIYLGYIFYISMLFQLSFM